jgi:predicted nucleotidyltransferase
MLPSAIGERVAFSDEKIKEIREKLLSELGPDSPVCVVVNGSYARREASKESDIDFFLLNDAEHKEKHKDLKQTIGKIVMGVVGKPPAKGGAFDNAEESIEEMEQNIGGASDTNEKITRRILFLLEGDWLYGDMRFATYRQRVVKQYIREGITDHQFSRFFLNDLIRYYRTVCVDFEFKTREQGKDWGTRNIKLIFPRKLMYFSGVLVCAETAQQTYQTKIATTVRLLGLTPIERLVAVCGDGCTRALQMYGDYLRVFSDPATRAMASKVTAERKSHVEDFNRLKNAGHHFSWELAKLLRDTYDVGHPIHNALLL